MLITTAIKGIIIKINKKGGGTARLNSGKIVNINNGKFKLGQELFISNNNNIIYSAEENPWQKEQVSWETE